VFLTLAWCCPDFHNPGQIFVLGGEGGGGGIFFPLFIYILCIKLISEHIANMGFQFFNIKNWRSFSKKLKKIS
jgi:hypothetical protein